MSTPTQNITVLAGRILLGLLFLVSGVGKIAGFDGTVGYISAQHLPLPALAAALTIVVELGGGIALVTGLWTRQAALVLAAFTLLTAFVFHAFWSAPEAAKAMQQIQFLKNLSIAGGLFVLAAFGPGRISLAPRRAAA
jgi:putative oxidoreductase|nr:DoxX family protein [Caldimonas sp.]